MFTYAAQGVGAGERQPLLRDACGGVPELRSEKYWDLVPRQAPFGWTLSAQRVLPGRSERNPSPVVVEAMVECIAAKACLGGPLRRPTCIRGVRSSSAR